MKSSDFQLISSSMLNYMFCMNRVDLSEKELFHMFDSIDYGKIEDRFLSDDPLLYPYIHWDRLEKMQSVRIAARNLDVLNYIDLKRYKYSIREIFFLIKKDYNILFKYFNFDFKNLSNEDAYFLLCIGNDEFYNMIEIQKYKFNFIEMMNIIRAYKYKKNVIIDLNYSELKNYQITEILIATGEESLDLFDIKCLSTLNWLDLLSYQPNFLYICDFEIFLSGDPFNLVQLVILFDKPDLTYLIDEIDKNEITPFGWEKLREAKPETFPL